MKYDISKRTAPKMPNLGKGTECIIILLSKASKEMRKTLVPIIFPILGAHISGSEFHSWKELLALFGLKSSTSACICRLSEPTFAQSREQHMQSPGNNTCSLQTLDNKQ